ncbi:MAG: hypothetical protein IJ799_02605, partial [Bacteroidales bacterium]|nr:hypothetical protein [Bacteroidales bacterium]
MKQVLMILAAMLLGAVPAADTKKDSDGHVLTKLWSSYREASGADRPKEQARILEKIKAEASSKRLPFDWYDAALKYSEVRASSNWKLRDSLSKRLAAEVEAFDYPVVGLVYRIDSRGFDDIAAFAEEHRKQLEKSRNPEFWTRLQWMTKYSNVLPQCLGTDYDFALWYLFLRDRRSVNGELSSRARGNYPLEAFYDYQVIVRDGADGRKSRLAAFAEKYSGKAAALLAREDLLQMRFSELAGSGASLEADYLALRDECRSLQKEASSYRGTEKEIASCCRQAASILHELEASSIEASVEGRKLAVKVRNIKKVKVSLGKEGGKELFGTSLANPGQRFYVPDSLGCELPVLDDGEYSIVCSSGNERAEIRYERHSLSLAVREISSGIGVYVTDYITGEPLKKADIILSDANGKDLVVRKGLRLEEGFTPLEEVFSIRMNGNKWKYRFRAEATGADGHLRASRQDSPGYITKAGAEKQTLQALILTDRGAYNPGDKLFFKAIAYEGTYKWKTVAAGKALSVTLVDTQGKVISEKKLSSDAFGAVYGSFVLERSSRNGRYTVHVSDGKSRLAGRSVRVDDFVLPSFNLVFDDNDGLHLPGDEIKVSGRITAYSGHNLSSARAEWSVSGTEEPVSGKVELLPDGSFSFSFKASERSWAHYDIAVKVADGTGETREFRTWRSSREGVDLYLDLVNETEGHFSLPSRDKEAATSILSDPQASVRISSSPHPSLEIGWTLENGDGKVLKEGKMKEGAKLSLDLGAYPDGMYVVKARASVKTLAWKELKADRELAILKVNDGSRSIDADVRGLFKVPSGDALAIQVGHTGGPVWGVAEVFGSGDV